MRAPIPRDVMVTEPEKYKALVHFIASLIILALKHRENHLSVVQLPILHTEYGIQALSS